MRWLATLTCAVFGAVTVWALFCILYLNLSLAVGYGMVSVSVAAVVGAALCGLALGFGPRIGRAISAFSVSAERTMSGTVWIVLLIVAGIAARLVWILNFDAPQPSDSAVYFYLARGLLEQGQYVDSTGDHAYWPPGLPFWLFANFLVFGVHSWVPALGNVFLYAVTVFAVYRLAQAIATEAVGRFAALVVALWPNFVFSVGLASKELLVAALLPVALLLHIRAAGTEPNQTRPFLPALASGACIGFGSLAQPSLMLFPAVFVADLLMRRVQVSRALTHLGALVLGMILVIAPWTARNFAVFGQIVPIATNGGDVFYRSNNPLATGGYTPMGEVDLRQYGELERARIGSRLGKEWIRDNPGQFVELAIKKQILFLGDDAVGAYAALKRGLGDSGPRYVLLKAVSNIFWLALWVLILAGWRSDPDLWRSHGGVLLQMASLYFLAIDTVFESGGRHHVPLLGVIALLSALPAAAGRVASGRTRSGSTCGPRVER